MRVVSNETYVRGRAQIGTWSQYISLGLLGVGFFLSFQLENLGPQAIYGAYAAMIGALLLLNFGRLFTRRFGSRFRQDQWLVPGLRGLDNRHTLFNYASPDLPDHILVGPTGLYVFVPRAQGGTIRFDGQRWSRGSVAGGLLRTFAEGGIGNPLSDIRRAMPQLATYLQKHGPDELVTGLEAKPIVVFTNPGTRLEVRSAPVPVVHVRELRAIFRRAKQTLEPEKIEELKQVLGRETEGPGQEVAP
jgi:hypothetical protein